MRADRSTVSRVSLLIAASFLVISGCGGGSDVPTASITGDDSNAGSSASKREDPVTLVASGEFRSPAMANEQMHPEVSIKTSVGTIKVRLNWEKAPRTVANFLYNYVETGFYDQTLVHYVENGYLIACGGYTLTSEEKATEPPIPCEAHNNLSNKRGTIAMARRPGFANSATSQFFINLVDNPGLDHKPGEPDGINGYCVFGEVIEGMDVVDKIAQAPVHDKEDLAKTPVQPIVVESVTRVK